ncbi:MAG: hypothetical protein Greene071421_196 [Parcubacteria group bacterium Greene0714_21]|nr:MAG: hypothetical protein Greene041639_340 [Parcubacteria group bacterium Greene0416_39]TSC97717.1 MAG: hypothetical protein Greene101447_354 [Parcubacteria group bacterium Greene1014_47]TSD04360.1 MAG: hypothetical protein Greene071421_196 [Parcubacteria group bacterium Greene0714_21]
MDPFLNGQFYSPTKGPLSLEAVLDALKEYMEEKPHNAYELVVGCDSSPSEEPTFPVVVVALRKGEGGRFFLKRVQYPNKKFYHMQERILQEVYLSCQLALYLRDAFGTLMKQKHPEISYQFEYIHADIGEKGPTKDMIKEVTGLIRGNGFEPRIKPYSFAASTVADRYS